MNSRVADYLLANLFVTLCDDVVEVDKQGTTLLCRLRRPFAVVIVGTNDFSILPAVAGDERTHDRCGPLGLSTVDVFPQIPAVGVDGLALAGHFDNALLGLVAVAFDRRARAVSFEFVPAIVVTELHDDKVTRPEPLERACPNDLR